MDDAAPLQGGPAAQYRLVDGCIELVERAALAGAVVVILEDLHWADPATILVARTIAFRLSALPIVLLITYRPSPQVGALDALVDAAGREGAVHLRLEPLDPASVTGLVRHQLSGDPGPRLLARVAGASGNPLFVNELVAALLEDGAIEMVDGRPEVRAVTLPPSLRVTILRRLSFLEEPALAALRTAAILGTTFDISDLAAVSGRPAVELLATLREPLRARIIEEAGTRLRFRHDLIREAVYADLPLNARTALHRDAAKALAAAGAAAAEVAEQYLRGAIPGDGAAVHWLQRTAREERSRAPESAMRFLERAIELLPDDDPLSDGIRVDLADLLAYSGRPSGAAALAEEVLGRSLGATLEARALQALVQAHVAQGRWLDVVQVVSDAAQRPGLALGTRARLLGESALARIWTGDLDGAETEAEQALRMGEQAGDSFATWNALGNLSAVADKRGRFEKGVTLARRGADLAARTATDGQRRLPHIALGAALVSADRLREAISTLQLGRQLGERMGTQWDLPFYHAMLALPLQSLGEWDQATAEAEAALSCADEMGSHGGRVGALGTLARIAIHRDEIADAVRLTRTATAIVDELGPQWGGVPVIALLEVDGDLDAAAARLVTAWDRAQRGGQVEAQLGMGPEVVRLALATGARATAEDVTEELERLAPIAGVPVAQAGALLSRGRLNGDPDLLIRAVEAYQRGGRAPAGAAAAETAAAALMRHGRTAEAMPWFDDALATFEALQARRDIARIRSTMRALGIRRGSRSAHRPARSGWEALTATEQRIVALVAEGLTNPEIGRRLFISPRTVQSHVAHVFTKLGLTSRVELAARVASQATVI